MVNASCIWASGPGIEAQNRHDAILEPAAGHAGALAHRHGLDRIVAEHEAQRVGVVHGDVEDHATAGARAR